MGNWLSNFNHVSRVQLEGSLSPAFEASIANGLINNDIFQRVRIAAKTGGMIAFQAKNSICFETLRCMRPTCRFAPLPAVAAPSIRPPPLRGDKPCRNCEKNRNKRMEAITSLSPPAEKMLRPRAAKRDLNDFPRCSARKTGADYAELFTQR